MLFVTTQTNKTTNRVCYVGQPFPVSQHDVYDIQADGDELEVCSRILNEKIENRVGCFTGDDAYCIAYLWGKFQPTV